VNFPDALSEPFTVSAGPAVSLRFTEQPTQVDYGLPMPTVRLQLLDEEGNLAPAPAEVTIALAPSETPAELLGTLAHPGPLGFVEFESLRLRGVGTFVLIARSGALEARSGPIDVLPVQQRLFLACGCGSTSSAPWGAALLFILWLAARAGSVGRRAFRSA
jgi:hypothetical protein